MDEMIQPRESFKIVSSDEAQFARADSAEQDDQEYPGLGTLAANDPKNPHAWSKNRKLLLHIAVFLTSFTPTLQASVFVASVNPVVAKFDVTLNESLLGISLCAIGFAVGPALASTASELFGRRWILIGSIILCLAFNVVAATANSFAVLLVGRTLSGITGSPSVTLLMGICNDLYPEGKGRDLLISLYGVAMVWSTQLGPLIGEAVVDQQDWRWSMWTVAILLGVCLVSLIPLQETFAPEILRQQKIRGGAKMESRQVLSTLIKKGLWRPVHMLFVEPLVLPCALTVAVSQVILFVNYVAVPAVLLNIYHFTDYQVGLSFLSLFLGSIIGLIVVKFCELRIVEARRKQAEVEKRPARTEDRLYPAMIGGVIQPVTLFWFAWTSRESIHWIVPLLAMMLWSTSFTLTQLGMPIYKNAYYSAPFGASALAPDLMLRYALSSFFPLFTPNMIDRMTVGWAMSFFAFLSIPMALIPFYIFRHGSRMVERSRYLPKDIELPVRR